MKLQALIREIHWLEWQLRVFEDKYSVLSHDFHQAYQSGELAEFDDPDLPQQRYRELLRHQPLVNQLRYTYI